jgi:Ca-activated chloride channel family protein
VTAFVFLVPPWWPALLALPLLLVLAWRLEARAERRNRALLGARLAAAAGERAFVRTRALAGAGAVLAIGIALLQPVGPGRDGDGGADVVLCVDVSWSMAARDEGPSRLGAARRAIGALVEALGPSRLALVAFAGDAQLLVPLTADGAAVALLAGTLAPGAHGRAGTDPGAAIDAAGALLARAGRGGAIVVCGDGEDFAGNGIDAAARARGAGLTVHTLGCGTEAGSKIALETGDGEAFLRDGAGADIVTRLERASLEAVAAAGGGTFRRVAPDGLRALHADVLLPGARAEALRSGRIARVSLAHWPLLAAFCLWMLRACLPERRR